MQIIWRAFLFTASTRPSLRAYFRPYFPQTMETLRQVVNMPREGRKPLDYDSACALFANALFMHCQSPESTRGSARAFCRNQMQWLTDQGFYIELTDGEYYSTAGVQ